MAANRSEDTGVMCAHTRNRQLDLDRQSLSRLALHAVDVLKSRLNPDPLGGVVPCDQLQSRDSNPRYFRDRDRNRWTSRRRWSRRGGFCTPFGLPCIPIRVWHAVCWMGINAKRHTHSLCAASCRRGSTT